MCSGARQSRTKRWRKLLGRYQLFPERLAQEHLLKEFLLRLGHVARLLGIGRHTQRESSSLPLFTFRFNAPAVVINDKIACHQMDAVFDWAI